MTPAKPPPKGTFRLSCGFIRRSLAKEDGGTVRHEGEKVVVSTEEASAGEKRHEVRYILAISLALVIALFAIIYATGVLSSSDPDNDNAALPRTTG